MKKLLKTTAPFDLTRETACRGFIISSVEPENSLIKIIFQIDDRLYHFKDGELAAYQSAGNIDDILLYGNTVGELLALNGIVQFVQKNVYPIVAIYYPDDAEVLPSIKISLKVECYRDEYSRDEISPIFELKTKKSARITNASYNKSLSGYATATCKIRLKNAIGNWSDWIDFNEAVNQEATAIQFKNHYVLTEIEGSDEAKIFDCKVDYITDSENSAADMQEIILKDQELDFDAGPVYVLIKHSELADATLKCFVKFQSLPLKRENIVIGTGNGETKTYYLGTNGGIDLNINQSSLKLETDSFNYNTANATVELKAAEGAEVRASYEYELDSENWLEMAKVQVESEATRFIFRNSAKNKKISAIKISVNRLSGRVENQVLGVGTGKPQKFQFEKRAKAENISCTGTWAYDEDSRILAVTAPIDEEIKISYEWVGTLPTIKNIFAGLSV